MKKIKAVVIILSILLALFSFASCSKSMDYNLTVSIVNQKTGETILSDTQITIKGTEDNPPSVLDVAEKAFATWDINYTLESTGKSISSIKGVGPDSTSFESETQLASKETDIVAYNQNYFWDCLINDKTSSNGKQDTVTVKDGDTLKFIYTSVTEVDRSNEVASVDKTETTK